jgi:hypothetical protein
MSAKEIKMAERNMAAFGMYPDRVSAEEAADAFQRAGFRGTDVSFLHPENTGTKDLAHEKHTKAPEGAAMGALPGGIVGAGLCWMAALGLLASVPALNPLVSPLIVAGPVVSALAGLGVGGLLGGLIGALIGAGLPEYEARRYRGRVRNRGVLLSVHCDNPVWVKRARKVLSETGSTNIATSREARADFAASDKPHHRRVSVGA